jgi:hypothetical protein
MKEYLLNLIKDKGKEPADVYTALNIGVATWYRRLKTGEWRRNELKTLKEYLALTDKQIAVIIDGSCNTMQRNAIPGRKKTA